jgi:hypothetical protein
MTDRRASAFHHKGFYNQLGQMLESLRDSAGVRINCTGLEQILDENGATDYDASGLSQIRMFFL